LAGFTTIPLKEIYAMHSLSQNLEKFANRKVRDRVRTILQPGSVRELIQQEINAIITDALNTHLLKEQEELLGRAPYQRTPGSVPRNGFKTVSVPGFFGRLFLRRPDTRMAYRPSPLLTALRAAGSNMVSLLAIRFWMKGASTRAVAAELKQTLGARCSSSNVSILTNALEPTLDAWQKQSVPAGIQYLYLDATYLPVRRPGSTSSQALLLALGVDSQGYRHFLGYFLGDRESLDSWGAFLKDLLARGLDPKRLRLVISDEHKAIEGAVASLLGCPHQLCLVHKIRNLRARVSRTDWKIFLADFKAIYWASSRESSLQSLGRFEERWGKAYPKAMAVALDRYDNFTRFMVEPKHTWRTLRSSNLIERFNREVKRRTRPAGAMHSELELAKLLYSVVEGQEASWACRKLWREVKTGRTPAQVAA
jgi:putative transposase